MILGPSRRRALRLAGAAVVCGAVASLGCGPTRYARPPAPIPVATPVVSEALPPSAPREPASSVAAFSAEAAEAIDRAVLAAMAEGKLPGGVVVIGRKASVLFARAYGYRALTPLREPATMDTVYDLASLTKPVATATSVMILVAEGRVHLDESVVRYLPELSGSGKDAITVRQLLTHTSGLVVETPISDYSVSPDPSEALRRIAATRLVSAPGEAYRYSDAGFFVLGELVHRVSGQTLDVFAKERIFVPLGMRDTGFLPSAEVRARAALTEPFDGSWMRGTVHDPRARAAGGVAGHAGVFSTPEDMVLYAQGMLGRSDLEDRVLRKDTLRAMMAPHDVPGAVRALGWDVRSAYSSNRGTLLSPRAVGHGGYTGTSLWVDPEKDLFVLLLSNRVHPDGKGAVNPLAGRIADVAVAATRTGTPPGDPGGAGGVETGIDVLVSEGFARLRGAHVALVTNASGRSRTGARTIDLLNGAEGVHLACVFAPEHGLGSDKDERIADGRDAETGLPVYSLYGDRFEPSPESLAGVDTIVVDLPDAGSRFFTYASTLKYAMLAGATRGLRVMVLDRPNPIDAVDVAGPVLVPRGGSFVNHHALPVRHGMTMGELAILFDADLHAGTPLEVVRMRGYQRGAFYDETGLPWTNPSPNLRSTDEALLYDGVGLLEATNLSVGRGTETPFEVVGAPYVEGAALEAALRAAAPAGVTVARAVFTPTASRFHGQSCGGVRFTVRDRRALDPVALGLTVAVALHRLYPAEWHVAELDRMVADKRVVNAVEEGQAPAVLAGLWKDALFAFRKKRDKYLLYP